MLRYPWWLHIQNRILSVIFEPIRLCSVVVITSAWHMKGPWFKTGWEQTFRKSLVAQMVESARNAEGLSSMPGSRRSPGEGNHNPLQYSCLENPVDGKAWQANCKELDTTERLQTTVPKLYLWPPTFGYSCTISISQAVILKVGTSSQEPPNQACAADPPGQSS